MLAAVVQILVGLASLLFGRRLYWLFIGLAGFLFGMLLGGIIFREQPQIVSFFLALVIGAGMAALALFIQRPLIALGAFFGLGALFVTVANALGITGPLSAIVFLVGGILGAVLVFLYFDWALIINSSLSGAGAIAAGLAALLPFLGGLIGFLLLIALAVVGIGFQARDLRGELRG
jgi:hypothetical protein